jgi:transcriptional regulator of arginine metabolism
MKNKKIRHQIIKEIISTSNIGSQDDLLKVLTEKGFSLTQATLSRDLKSLKVVKQATEQGEYHYILPNQLGVEAPVAKVFDSSFAQKGFLSIDFSGNMAVIKTRPGYAAGIASDIDAKAYTEILGSIAGDDTILLIIREGVSRDTVLDVLSTTIPDIRA